jgi:hypothetical protein
LELHAPTQCTILRATQPFQSLNLIFLQLEKIEASELYNTLHLFMRPGQIGRALASADLVDLAKSAAVDFIDEDDGRNLVALRVEGFGAPYAAP